MSKFTPGPWRVHATNSDPSKGVVGEVVIVHETDRSPSGFCCPAVALPFGESPERLEMTQANAHLIAAAPDLLAACKRAVDLYGKPGGPWNVPGEPGSWLAEARAAIEKAEGGGR